MSKRETVRKMIEAKCLLRDGDFSLSAGEQSNFYFDCKRITLDGKGLSLVSDLFLEEIAKLPTAPVAIGGLTLGADFIAAGVIMRAADTGRGTIYGSIVRKEPKKHGTRNKIENQLPAGTPIVVIDDVITSGKSTITACDELTKEGYEIVGVIALVDREAGGLQTLEQKYRHATALFRASEFQLAKQDESKPKNAIAG